MSEGQVLPGDSVFDRGMESAGLSDTSADDGDGQQALASPHRSRVLFVTSEMADYVKTGGLGEVSSSLPRAMARFCDVRVLIPGYPEVVDRARNLELVRMMPGTAGLPPWTLGRISTSDRMTVYVVLCDELYRRDGTPYGDRQGRDFIDNHLRFGRLSLAAAEIASGLADESWRPDVIHANDWPTALTLGYLRWTGVQAKSIFTIHNLAYQGLFDPSRLGELGIPESAFSVEGPEFHGQLSFLKTGIYYASHVTTVSETYAQEITRAEHGLGLDGLLASRMAEGRLSGILNGIDESWLAAADAVMASGDPSQWKRERAAELRRIFALSASEGPLFSIVSRLVHQKGVDLSIAAADRIVRNGGQIVAIGKGDPQLEEEMSALSRRYPGQVSARIGFDDEEARSIFAGSDFLLMPSRFEPCGLSQMYAQSMASLPIACRTGGLADTIDDGKSGFLFNPPNTSAFTRAVGRAFRAHGSKGMLCRMRRHALAKRFDWERSARRYLGLYATANA
jgi:starch synthase